MKLCVACNKTKSKLEFAPSQYALNRSRCRECCSLKYKEYQPRRKRNLVWQQGYKQTARLKFHGLSNYDYALMLRSQGKKCRICKRILAPATIDHDHKTRKVRGLLCHSCNKGLGFFYDNPLYLLRAAFYLLGKLGQIAS